MSQRQLSPDIRQIAELQYAEIVGRLYACEHLENEFESIQDHRVLYGWNMLTQEVLIRVAEASLKLLHMLDTDSLPPRGHSLASLWNKLSSIAKEEVLAKHRNFANGEVEISFGEYDMDDFQDVRYSFERRAGGQTMSFEHRRLYLDSLAVTSLAKEWLGEIKVWPWAGLLDPALKDYKILPIRDGRFDVLADNPIEPMDWAGAIIEPKDGKYIWTLYFGFTDSNNNRRGYKLSSLAYLWATKELLTDSISECVEQIHRAYQEPCAPLRKALEEAAIEKGLN